MVDRAVIEEGITNEVPSIRQYWFEQYDVDLSNNDLLIGLTDPDPDVRQAAHNYKVVTHRKYEDILGNHSLSPLQETSLVDGFASGGWSVQFFEKFALHPDEVYEDFHKTFLKLNFAAATGSPITLSFKIEKALSSQGYGLSGLEETPLNWDEVVPFYKSFICKNVPNSMGGVALALSYAESKGISLLKELANSEVPVVDRMSNINHVLFYPSIAPLGSNSSNIQDDVFSEKDYHRLLNEFISIDQEDTAFFVLKKFIQQESLQKYSIPKSFVDQLVVHPSGNIRCLVEKEELWRSFAPTKSQMKELIEKEPSEKVKLSALKIKSWGGYRPSEKICNENVTSSDDSQYRTGWFERPEALFREAVLDYGLLSKDRFERLAALNREDLKITPSRLALLYNDPAEEVRAQLYAKSWGELESYKDVYARRELNFGFRLFAAQEKEKTFKDLFGLEMESLNLSSAYLEKIASNQEAIEQTVFDERQENWSSNRKTFVFSQEVVDSVAESLLSAEETNHFDFRAMVYLTDFAQMVSPPIAEVFIEKYLKASIEENRIYQSSEDGSESWGMSELVSRMVQSSEYLNKERLTLALECQMNISNIWPRAKDLFDEELYCSALDVYNRPDWSQLEVGELLEHDTVQYRVFSILDEFFDVSNGSDSLLLASEKMRKQIFHTIEVVHTFSTFNVSPEKKEKYPNLMRFLGEDQSAEAAVSSFESEILKNKASCSIPEIKKGATGWSAL